MLQFTQEQIEKEFSDVLPHGTREEIAKGTGIYPKIVDAYFNPHDERKSPHFTVLHIQSVLDNRSPQVGEAFWQRLCALREGSRTHVFNGLSVDHELGKLSKEFTDIIVAKCEGKSRTEIGREIDEARRQLDIFERAVYGQVIGDRG